MDLVKRFSTNANKTAAGGPWFARRAFLSVFIWAFPLLAQDGISLRGKVQGTGGTQLGGAKATLVNEETQAKQETITAEDGSFAFAQVAPGDYLLRVEAKGFEPYRASIQLGTDEPASLKIRLKLQTVEEELIVRPDTSDDRLSPESNTQSMKVDETFFSGLPLAVDYLLPFIETFTYPGARGSEGTSIVVDGIEGGELDMPTSAIRTVKINRNPYSAEFQHPGAGRAEITTKHGHKRRYYGSMAFFARNSVFDARIAFAHATPDLNRRFVEGSLAGPLPGNYGHFFVAGDRLTNDQSTVVNALNTVALTGPVNINVPVPQRRDHLFARAQWSLTEMQSLSLSYTFTDHSSTNNGVGALSLPEQGASAVRHTHRMQLIDSAAFSPQLRNEIILVFKDQTSRSGSQGDPRVSYLEQQISGFAQDTLRALPNLSLTLGLRYDWQQTLDSRKNFAPRLAVAFTPGKRRRTVLRGGAGIFYDNLPRSDTEDALLLDGMRVREIDISYPSYPDPFLGGQVTSPPPSITRVATVARSPYLIQASAAVEEEISRGTWLSLDYSFLHGARLFRLVDVNAPVPSALGLRPDPNFSNIAEVQSTAFLRGHALTLTFRGGLGKRFRGYAQYVFSKYTNDVSSSGPGTFLFPADNYDLRPEIGPADFDRRHRLNFAGTVQLPFGLRAGSIFSAASGAPFNVITGSDPFGDTITRPPGVTRNTGRGPANVQFDVRVTKVFSLQRRVGAERSSRRSMELSVDACT